MTPDPRLTIIRCERCGVGGDEVARLRVEVARLEAENQTLREERDDLRVWVTAVASAALEKEQGDG